VLLGFTAKAGAVSPTEAVTRPDLSEFEPGVRTALEAAISDFQSALADAPDPRAAGEAWGELGMHYQAHHLQGLASTCYARAADLDPADSRWPYLAGFVALEGGDFEAAESRLSAAAELSPDDAIIRLRLAETALAAGNLALARERFDGLSGGPGMTAARHSGLGRIAVREGRYKEAAGDLESALRLAPSATRLRHPLGMAYRQLGDRGAASANFAARGNGQVPVPDPLLISIGERSQSAQFFLEQGYAAARAGQTDRAVEAFRRAVAASPDDVSAMLSLAQGLNQAGATAEAREWLDKAVARHPEDPVARLRLGMAQERAGEEKPALASYEAAVALDPGLHQARFLLGDSLMRAGRYAEAAEAYGALPDEDASGALFRYREGLAAVASGNCEAALQAFSAGRRLRPDNGELMQAWARTASTCETASDAERASAEDVARQLFGALANREHAATLAMALAANGRFDEAADLQAQVAGRPLAGVADQQALARYRAGQRADAPWPAGDAVFYPPRLNNDG
jgi:tetratricopeptide (TPR) repeat protein